MTAPARTRILLGLTAGVAAEASISLAARLAASLEAAVHGLLVEDEALFDAAGLPFTRIVSRSGATVPDFTVPAMERAFVEAERMCRRSLSHLAQASRVPWSMQCERGEVAASLSAHAQAGDIVIVPDAAGVAPRRLALAAVRLVAARTRGVVLNVRPQEGTAAGSGPVVVIDEGGPEGEAVARIAAQLAAGLKRPLHVVTVGAGEETVMRLEQITAAAGSLPVSWSAVRDAGQAAIRLAALTPGLVVGNVEGEVFGSDAAVIDMQRASRAPLVLLRGGDDGAG